MVRLRHRFMKAPEGMTVGTTRYLFDAEGLLEVTEEHAGLLLQDVSKPWVQESSLVGRKSVVSEQIRQEQSQPKEKPKAEVEPVSVPSNLEQMSREDLLVLAAKMDINIKSLRKAPTEAVVLAIRSKQDEQKG
jgi:hypothetical protein